MSPRTERTTVLFSLILLAAFSLFSTAASFSQPAPEHQFWMYLYFRSGLVALTAFSCWASVREIRLIRQSPGSIDWIDALAIPLGFTVAALCTRFYGLADFAIWTDEDLQLSQVIETGDAIFSAAVNQQPPLAYFTGLFSAKIFGLNTFSIRLLPALTGALAIWPFYSWLRGILARDAAMLGAFFFLVNQLLLSVSRDGRPYMPGAFLFVIFLHLWSATNRNPEEKFRWIALFSCQALLQLTLSMQPVLLLGTYFLILGCTPALRAQLQFKRLLICLILSALVALPPNIYAALFLEGMPYSFGFGSYVWAKYSSIIYKSIGWAACFLPVVWFYVFANRKKSPMNLKEAETRSLLLLTAIFPLIFIFLFESVLSTVMKPRYILFFLIIFMFSLAHISDQLIRRYRLAVFSLFALLFAASNLTIISQKREEPTWHSFYRYVNDFGKPNELAFVLNFIPNWSEVQSGFVGVQFYRPLLKNISLRAFGTNEVPYADDTLTRLKDHYDAPNIYLFVTGERDNLATILNSYKTDELEKVVTGPEASVYRLTNRGSASGALKVLLNKIAAKDSRLLQDNSYRQLAGVVYLLEQNCETAAKFLGRNENEFMAERYQRLVALAGSYCRTLPELRRH